MRTTVIVSFAIVLLMAFIAACGGATTPEVEQVAATQETTTEQKAEDAQSSDSQETAPTSESTTEGEQEGEKEQEQQTSSSGQASSGQASSGQAGETPEAKMEEEEDEENGDSMMEADAMWDVSDELKAYAAEHAGGPGAIYIGDSNWEALSGPSVTAEFMEQHGVALGDDEGNVPLDALLNHKWVFESDYYRSLPEKARLTNPTALVSEGEEITLQHACINRTLLWCKHMEAYFAANVLERTNGQIEIEITSFPELGLAGFDTMSLLADGTLSLSEIYGGYVGGEFPTLAVQYLWGLWPDHETHYLVLTNIFEDIEKVIKDETGATVLYFNWIAGDDQFFFSKHRLESPEDFKDLKTRSHSTELSDWINYMGAKAQAMAFAEVYTALERGILDAGVTGAGGGLSQRWYEVTDYMNGRLYSFNSTTNVVNKDVWDGIPADLQQILLEEGAKHELEALRLTAIQNVTNVERNIQAGLELVEFGPEARALSAEAARNQVIPNWLKRVGYPDKGQSTVDVFNDKIGPFVGLEIVVDASAESGFNIVDAPITMGPQAP